MLRTLETILSLSLLASMVRYATPLILAALGGMYSERGGVINIALEGIMLAGAFTAAAVTVKVGNPWIGLMAAATAGVLVALIHAVASIQFKADQVVVETQSRRRILQGSLRRKAHASDRCQDHGQRTCHACASRARSSDQLDGRVASKR